MAALKTMTFAVLACAFLLRTPRAIRYRDARLTWLATGIGALALLTLGTVIPQEVLDAPLGGHNVLKLVQTSLALAAIWFDAQAAIMLGPTTHPMSWISLAVIVCVPATPFLFIRRTGHTSQHFLDDSIRQFPAWLYAVLYLAALSYVATRLIVAFYRHRELGARLIEGGAAALIGASVVEVLNFTLEFTGGSRARTADVLSAVFNLVFYLGIFMMTAGILAYAYARTLRRWRIPRILRQLATATPGAQPPQHVETGRSALGRLYASTVAVRDLIIAGRIHPNHRQLRALRDGERIIAHNLTDPPRPGRPTVTTYSATHT